MAYNHPENPLLQLHSSNTELTTKDEKTRYEYKDESGNTKSYEIKKNKKDEYVIKVDKHNTIRITEERLQKLELTLKKFLDYALEAINTTEDQLKNVRESNSNKDYIVPTPITEDSQHKFVSILFGIQSKFKTEKQNNESNKSFKNWKNSHAIRSRLIIINAEDLDPEFLAERIVNTSTIERLLIINQNSINEDELKFELKKKLLEKFPEPKDREAIAGIEEEEAYVDMVEPTISHLMGPHLIQEDTSIDKDTLEARFPQIFSPIDGAIYCDNDEQAAKDFLLLCESVDNDIEPVRFKTSHYQLNKASNYTYAGTSKELVIELATSGKSSEQMLKAENEEGDIELTLNPKYSFLLSKTQIKCEMKEQGINYKEHIKDADIDKIRKLIFDKFLYDPHVTPNAINPIISGASSLIQIQKSNAVSKEQFYTIAQRYTATAVELLYALTSMTRDGGSDQVQEELAETWRYKSFFYSVLGEAQKNGIKEDEAIFIAFSQTLDAYIGIERHNKTIYKLERSYKGAKACRNFSIEYQNKVKESNDKGIIVLNTAPAVFFVSTGLVAIGILTLFPPAGLTAAGLVLGFAGASLGLDLLSRAISATAMYFQKKANRKDLTLSTLAGADANLKKNQAQAVRNTLLAERRKDISDRIKTIDPECIEYSKLGKIKTTSEKPLEYFFMDDGVKEVTKRWPLSFLGYKRTTTIEIPEEERENHISQESKKEIVKKLNVLIKHDAGTNGKLPPGKKIDKELIREFTQKLFKSMAKRSNLSITEEHDKDYEEFVNSAEIRSHLVIVQAPENDAELKILAKRVFKVTPQCRLLIIGLNDDKKDRLMNEIKDLLIMRLKKCENFKDIENNITNDKRYVAHQTALILQKENRLDEIIEFNKNHTRKKVTYNDETDPNTVIDDFVNICDKLNNFNSLKELLPYELLIKPHLFQEDNDISKETLCERYPHFEENIEEMSVLCNSDDIAKQAFITSAIIKPKGIPTFITKSENFEQDDLGNFHCACKSNEAYKAILSNIGGEKTVSELIGKNTKKNSSAFFSALSQNISSSNTEYKYVTMSSVFSDLFNLNLINSKLSENQHSVCRDDVDYMRTILFDEALYEANMSPGKSTQTISKSDSKLAALAGSFIAQSLNLNIIGKPQNLIEEVRYAISFMALDTGVDFEDEILKNKDLYRSIFQKLKEINLNTNNLDSVEATEKAYIDTLKFYLSVKNNDEINKEKKKGDVSREMAYMKINDANEAVNKTEKEFSPLPAISLIGLAMGIASVAILGISTFGAGLVIPAAIGITFSAIGLVFYLGRIGFLYPGLAKSTYTNKESIPRSNFFSKDATFKIGDAFKSMYLLKDKFIEEKKSSKVDAEKKVKNKTFEKKIDERNMAEMTELKSEFRKIIKELLNEGNARDCFLFNSVSRKLFANHEWNNTSPFQLYRKEINNSELNAKLKMKIISRLREVVANSKRIDTASRKMNTRISI